MAATNKAAVELMKSVMNKLVQGGGFSRHLNGVTILDGGNGNMTASMKVEEDHCNPNGTLHGAFATLIVDNLSGLGLLTYPNVDHVGVSVQINMTYTKAAAIGEDILIKSKANKVGKQLAFLTVDILNKENGKLITSGTHTKYIGKKPVPGGEQKPK